MMTKCLWVTLLAALLMLNSGCALLVVGGAAAAGAGGYAYVNGEARSTETASLDQAWEATQAAMKELELSVTSQAKDALEARLVARNARDKRITIRLKKLSDRATEIRLRVGTFGDETLSRMIFQEIQRQL